MDCINSFRNFFLRKKTFNLIWEKIRTFQVLCIDFIKEISASLSSSASGNLSKKGLKCKFENLSGSGDIAGLHYLINKRRMSNLVRNKPVINNFGKPAYFPNFLCMFKQNSPFLHSKPPFM